MALKHVLYLTVLVGLCAIVLQIQVVRERVRLFADEHTPGLKQLVTSSKPFDLWFAILSKLGFVEQSQGKLTPTESTIRYERDPLYTKEELSQYTGEDGSPGLYLAILGRVYDVATGVNYYGAGKGYGFFTGRDGTKAFMSGDFTEEGLVDEVTGLSLPQMLELENWIIFYDKTYIYKGKLIGNFYDEHGNPKEALLDAQKGIDDANMQKDAEEEHRRKFPPCNIGWTKTQGGSVTCTGKSGGIERDWVGIPRKYYASGDSKPKCVCIRTTGPPYDDPTSVKNRGELDNPHIEEYADCNPTAVTCTTSL